MAWDRCRAWVAGAVLLASALTAGHRAGIADSGVQPLSPDVLPSLAPTSQPVGDQKQQQPCP
jgi:hypothetical protein